MTAVPLHLPETKHPSMSSLCIGSLVYFVLFYCFRYLFTEAVILLRVSELFLRISVPSLLYFAGIQVLISLTWMLKMQTLWLWSLAQHPTPPVMYEMVVEGAATELVCVASRSFPYSVVSLAKVEGWFPNSLGCETRDLFRKWRYD